jgi:hypothetical protein
MESITVRLTVYRTVDETLFQRWAGFSSKFRKPKLLHPQIEGCPFIVPWVSEYMTFIQSSILITAYECTLTDHRCRYYIYIHVYIYIYIYDRRSHYVDRVALQAYCSRPKE